MIFFFSGRPLPYSTLVCILQRTSLKTDNNNWICISILYERIFFESETYRFPFREKCGGNRKYDCYDNCSFKMLYPPSKPHFSRCLSKIDLLNPTTNRISSPNSKYYSLVSLDPSEIDQYRGNSTHFEVNAICEQKTRWYLKCIHHRM